MNRLLIFAALLSLNVGVVMSSNPEAEAAYPDDAPIVSAYAANCLLASGPSRQPVNEEKSSYQKNLIDRIAQFILNIRELGYDTRTEQTFIEHEFDAIGNALEQDIKLTSKRLEGLQESLTAEEAMDITSDIAQDTSRQQEILQSIERTLPRLEELNEQKQILEQQRQIFRTSYQEESRQTTLPNEAEQKEQRESTITTSHPRQRCTGSQCSCGKYPCEG